MTRPATLEQIQGALLGLAIGDALGYPAEFRSRAQLLAEIGPEGITEFVSTQDGRFSRPIIIGRRHPPGTVTDDTQMSVALAEGLLDAGPGAELDALMVAVGRRFVTWSESPENDRSPGETCLTGCAALRRGVPWREAGVARSKGCGSAMRVAPIGLLYQDLERVCEVARASSLLTHGHPAALESAAAAALGVALALRGESPEAIHREILRRTGGRSPDLDRRLAELPGFLARPPEETLSEELLGEGWVAEEAVASALYCFWRHPDDYRAGVLEAVNTDGDSDSIATIAGSFLGARLGLGAIPARWIEGVEGSAELLGLGERVWRARTGAVAAS